MSSTPFISATVACGVLLTAGVSLDVLAAVWNLAEVDRDGKLSPDEFSIACHLCRMCRKGEG